MSDTTSVALPEITDDDIARVCGLLDLPESAFCGLDGCDPRDAVLKSMDTIDVAACPGSGKTTLLVAKLAILAEKWPYQTRGICVLSHTNAARREIENRLANHAGGRCLLSYPHFVGTIHGFVGGFLAGPWLRSLGYRIKVIDNEVAQGWRWSRLPRKAQYALKQKRCGGSALSAKSCDFATNVPFGANTDTYKACQKACCESVEAGYLCYDEVFVFACGLLDRSASATMAVRDRFPLLFVDEVQDNREDQSLILWQIFMEGDRPVSRQRFGDVNQAIYDSSSAAAATSDPFPDKARKRELPSSHRFGQSIAKLADPLGLVPYDLVGLGPRRALESGETCARHTVFLFGEGDAGRALEAYADLVLETFSDHELSGSQVVAVGYRHVSPTEDGSGKYPYHVGDYWPAYNAQLSMVEARPKSLVGYIAAGMSRAQAAGETRFCVESTADGLLRSAGQISHHSRKHLRVMDLLVGDDTARAQYRDLLTAFAVRREALTKDAWQSQWGPIARQIIEALAASSTGVEVDGDLLDWPDGVGAAENPAAPTPSANTYTHRKEGREVEIRLGSIHSVKGETHLATLVLETFVHRLSLRELLPWLAGERTGDPCPGVPTSQAQQRDRLKAHYVAMTRPSHLLCLAMRGDLLPDGRAVEALQARGWRVEEV